MTAWSNLPNAALIDQVLTDLQENPEIFKASGGSSFVLRRIAAAWDAGLDRVVDTEMNSAWDAAVQQACTVSITPSSAVYAILALIAYNNSPKYLNIPYEKLLVWATVSNQPASILLLPYVWIRSRIGVEISSWSKI